MIRFFAEKTIAGVISKHLFRRRLYTYRCNAYRNPYNAGNMSLFVMKSQAIVAVHEAHFQRIQFSKILNTLTRYYLLSALAP